MFKSEFIRVSCASVLFSISVANAQQPPSPNAPPPRPSLEQMQAVQDCASKQGVDLPPPPARPSQESGDHKGPPPPPKLTDDQKKIIDACFKANGLNPPSHHAGPDRDGPGATPRDRAGPPPEQDFD